MEKYKEYLIESITKSLSNYLKWINKASNDFENGEPLSRTPLVACEYWGDMMLSIKALELQNCKIDFKAIYEKAKQLAEQKD